MFFNIIAEPQDSVNGKKLQSIFVTEILLMNRQDVR